MEKQSHKFVSSGCAAEVAVTAVEEDGDDGNDSSARGNKAEAGMGCMSRLGPNPRAVSPRPWRTMKVWVWWPLVRGPTVRICVVGEKDVEARIEAYGETGGRGGGVGMPCWPSCGAVEEAMPSSNGCCCCIGTEIWVRFSDLGFLEKRSRSRIQLARTQIDGRLCCRD